MNKRFVSIWFSFLKTDWLKTHNQYLQNVPFALALPDHGRMRITEPGASANVKGVHAGMIVADAKVIVPNIEIKEDDEELAEKLLHKIALWCIRYSPSVGIDLPDGLIIEVTGCTHLWGGEKAYLQDISNRLQQKGFTVKAAIADTIGTAWAIARFGEDKTIIESGKQVEALKSLPPASLRLEDKLCERLYKLGLYNVGSFMQMQRSSLRRRFGEQMLLRIDQAFGYKEEVIQPIIPIEPYLERLPCLEPIQTRTGIEIALNKLLQTLSLRLEKEGKGVRKAKLQCYRVDEDVQTICIHTNHPSLNIKHLFKLFELQIEKIQPGLGIELFTLQVEVEDVKALQETFWMANGSLESTALAELLDHLQSRFGNVVHRYLPDEHHWPERSVRIASSLSEEPSTQWRKDVVRPILLLPSPEKITVTAPIPDYPPMMFIYQNKRHKIIKADGPERIEREWWIEKGLQRDYYIVEDEEGKRYWLFREGHYEEQQKPSWFLHGLFA